MYSNFNFKENNVLTPIFFLSNIHETIKNYSAKIIPFRVGKSSIIIGGHYSATFFVCINMLFCDYRILTN